MATAVAHVAVGVLALSGVGQAMAANYYWDIDGAAPGAGGAAPSGTWDLSTANWTTDATGSSAGVAYLNNGSATPVFSAGSNATGSYTVTLADGTSVSAAGLSFATGNVTLNAGGSGSVLTLTAPGVDVADGLTATVNQVLGGGAGLNKTGNGTLVLGFAGTDAGAYTGATTVSGGTLQSNFTNMPAAITNNATVVLRSSGTNTYAGSISGSGAVRFENSLQTAAAWTVNNDNAYAGGTTLTRVQLTLNGGGRLSGTSNITVANASSLTLDNSSGANNNRIADGATLTLNGGVFTAIGSTGVDTTETVGQIRSGPGALNYVNLSASGGTAGSFGMRVTAASLATDPGGVLLVRGHNLGTASGAATSLKFTSAPTLSGSGAAGTSTVGVIPGVYAESLAPGTDFAGIGTTATLATYDAANGVRQLTAGEYATTLAANANVAPGANLTASNDTTINAIEFGGAGNVAATAARTITVSSGKTLTLSSGTIYSNASTGTSTITGGTLKAGASGTAPLYVYNSNTMSISSAIQAGNLVKTGVGTLNLGTSVTNTGATYIDQGTVSVTSNGALGSAVFIGNNGYAIASSASGNYSGALALSNGVSYNIPLTIAGGLNGTANTIAGSVQSLGGSNTWSGPIHLTGPGLNGGDRLFASIAAQNGTLTLSGVISSDAPGNPPGTGLSFSGGGNIVLTGTSPNTYKGLTRIQNGTLIIEKDGALGTANQTSVDENTIMNGGTTNTLAFRGGVNYTTAEWVFTNGGIDPAGSSSFNGTNLGVIANISGDNKFAGHLGLGNAGSVGTGLNRIVVLDGSLEISGMITAQYNGSGGNRVRILDKDGPGELILSGDSNAPITNSFAAPFEADSGYVVDGGTLRLRSSNPSGGNVPSTMQYVQVNPGGTLALDNSLAVNTSRIGGSTSLSLTGGELQLVGNASTPVTQSLSNVSLTSFSTLSVVAPGSADTTLDAGSIDRSGTRGTILVRGVGATGAAKIVLPSGGLSGASGTGSQRSILPYAVGDASATGSGTDFVTIESGLARPLTAAEYVDSAALTSGSTALVNVNLTASKSITSNTTVNSLKISGATPTLSIGSGRTFTVASGALLNASGTTATISGGTLAFGNEGIVTTVTGSDMTIASAISGSNGLTKSGFGDLTLTGTNTYTGTTTVNAGTLVVSSDAALGDAGGTVALSGGALRYTADTVSPSRAFIAQSMGINAIDVATANVTLQGNISGSGTLTKLGSGTLTLTNTGNSVSALTVNDGVVSIPDEAALGNPTGQITLGANGGLQLTTDGMFFSHAVALTSTTTNNGFDIPTGVTVRYMDFSGSGAGLIINGPGRLVKNGGGTLVLGNQGSQNLYTGGTVINGGVLEYIPSDAGTLTNGLPSNTAMPTGVGYWTINNGATLRFNQGAAASNTSGSSFSSANRTIAVGPGGGTVEITAFTGDQANTGGLIGSTTLTKTGGGNLWLRANNSLFTGNISVAQGLLDINNDNNFGPAGSGVVADRLTLADGTGLRAAATVTLGANRGIKLSGGNATLSTLNNASLTVNGPISGTSTSLTLSPNGTGSIVLNGANTYTGETILTAGKLVFGSTFTTSSKLTVPDGASAQLTAGGNKVLKFGTLNLNSTGKLDLGDGRLVLTGSTVSDLKNLLIAGRNGGAWTGTGIYTSSAQAAADPNGIKSIGWAVASDLGATSWGGVDVTGTDLVARVTYYGDLTLDGKINGDDYTLADRALAKGGLAGTARWIDGDLNYDGVVNGSDFFLIDKSAAAWGGIALSPAFLTQREAQFGSEYVSQLVAAVPEPTSVGIIGLGALGFLGGRRRRQS